MEEGSWETLFPPFPNFIIPLAVDARDEIIFLGPAKGIFILSSSTSVLAPLRRLELRRADGDLSLSLSLEEGRELERVRRLDLRRFDGEVSSSLSFMQKRRLRISTIDHSPSVLSPSSSVDVLSFFFYNTLVPP